jgi:hypothetical protein
MKDLKRNLILAYDLAGDLENIDNIINKQVERNDKEKVAACQEARTYLRGRLDETMQAIKTAQY